jgi:hypothetical protein
LVDAIVLFPMRLDRLEFPGSRYDPPNGHRGSEEALPPDFAVDLDVGFVRVGPFDVEDRLYLLRRAGSRVGLFGPVREIPVIPSIRFSRPSPKTRPRDMVTDADLLDAPIGVSEQLQGVDCKIIFTNSGGIAFTNAITRTSPMTSSLTGSLN